MSLKPDDLPSDLASAQAALLIEREALRAEREARLRAEVERDATQRRLPGYRPKPSIGKPKRPMRGRSCRTTRR